MWVFVDIYRLVCLDSRRFHHWYGHIAAFMQNNRRSWVHHWAIY